jgi:hypothetical protein
MSKPLLLGLAVTALTGGAALADANHPEASFRTMINAGYQVTATAYVPPAEAKQVGMTSATPTIVITLQKGTSVAVCAFSAQNWIYMADADLEAATGCDYRSYASATPASSPSPAAPSPTPPSPASPPPASPVSPSIAPPPFSTDAPSETSAPAASTSPTGHGM